MKVFLTLLLFLVAMPDAEAQNWTRTAGPVEDEVFDLCIDSNGILFAATRLGVNRSTDGGANWTRPFMFPPSTITDSIITLAVAANGNILVSRHDGTYVSADGGTTFTQANFSGWWNPLLHYTVTASGRIIAVSSKTGMFVSDDHGIFWHDASYAGMEVPDFFPIAIVGSRDSVLTQNTIHSYCSTDDGATWSQVTGKNNVQQLLRHPNGVWLNVSIDSGLSTLVDKTVGWKPFGTDVHSGSTYTAAITRDGTILIASPAGVHAVKNLTTWSDISSGLPFQTGQVLIPISRFVEDPKNGVYYAATRTDAVWKSTPLAVIDPAEDAQAPNVYPNPLHDRATIGYHADEPAWTDIMMYDVLGNVRWKTRHYAVEGRNTMDLDASDLPSGKYLLVIRKSIQTQTQWVTILE